MTIKDRFFNYITTYTTSDPESGLHPSASREFDLANRLVDELKEIGVDSVELDEKCYIYARLNASTGYENKKSIGFIAHMDTAPDYNGDNVKPVIHENYDGSDITLEATKAVLSQQDFPHLKNLVGRTLITTDGSSLLGADDKAGIAEIMTMLETIKNENIPHGEIWISFTPDEEIGEGASNFSTDKFKADFAYTVDGDYEGEISYENFNAGSAVFDITGKNVHPGSAKDIMINAAAIATEIQSMLPADQTPEHTCDREGFIHLHNMIGNTASAKLAYIVRDHDIDKFNAKNAYLKKIEELMNIKYPEGTVKLTLKDSYRNMLEVVSKDMTVVDVAKQAISDAGIQPVSYPIRGGTDGATISFMGIPCPNLGTGGYAFHGPYEHITLEGMNTAVDVLINIVKIIAE